MDPEELLRQANEAIASGVPRADVDAQIRSMTNGTVDGTGGLRAIVNAPTEEDERLLREAERGSSPAGNFGRLAAQGATFGFGDEIAGLIAGLAPGGKTREEATADSRQRLEDLRSLNPGASLAAEIAGGLATGFGAAAGASRATGQATARGLVTAGRATTPVRRRGLASAECVSTRAEADRRAGLSRGRRLLPSSSIEPQQSHADRIRSENFINERKADRLLEISGPKKPGRSVPSGFFKSERRGTDKHSFPGPARHPHAVDRTGTRHRMTTGTAPKPSADLSNSEKKSQGRCMQE